MVDDRSIGPEHRSQRTYQDDADTRLANRAHVLFNELRKNRNIGETIERIEQENDMRELLSEPLTKQGQR